MNETTPHDKSRDTLQDIIRDLRRERRNGIILSIAIFAVLSFARWINDAPYAGNSLYAFLLIVVVGMRAADMEVLRAVSRLAACLAQGEASRPDTGPAEASLARGSSSS